MGSKRISENDEKTTLYLCFIMYSISYVFASCLSLLMLVTAYQQVE